MARSVYGQLNQANIGANMDKLLREIFEGDPEKYATEASTMDNLASSASSEAEFEKLDKVLDDYWKRNDMHGPIYEAKEIKQRADYMRRKDEYYRFKEAHTDFIGMLDDSYKVLQTDKKGGVLNISPEDVTTWTHEELTKELDKVNKIRESFSLAEKGYIYMPKGEDGKPLAHNTYSLASDIDKYHKSIMAGMQVLVDTGELPKDDDVLIRHIISGRTDKVKEHIDEQQQISGRLYKEHNDNLTSLSNLFNKVIAYEDKPDEFNAFLGTLPEEDKKYMGNILANVGGEEGMLMDYSAWADNIAADMESELRLRHNANLRHKEYTGKLYEEVDDSLKKQMDAWREEGSSHESSDELKRLREEVEKLKRERESKDTQKKLADTTKAVSESTVVAIDESTTTTTPKVDTTYSVPDKAQTSWYRQQQLLREKERKRLGEKVLKTNRENVAKAARDKGVTEAPLSEYLDAIIDDQTYEEYTLPEDEKKKMAINNEIGKSIKLNNPNIDRLFNSLNPSGVNKQDFSKSIIKTWKSLNQKAKFSYGSFSNFIDAIIADFETATDERDLQIQGVVK